MQVRGFCETAKILLFYVIFYATLCGFFFAMLAVFYQTIDPKIPKWQLDKSLIGNNPGLGFRPMPSEENVESTLIWYKSSSEKDYKYWTNELDKFLEVYKDPDHSDKRKPCNYTSGPEEGKVCEVNIADFSNCSSIHNYNYHRSAPCIFLKLNKIYNWVPEYYTDVKDLPSNMPVHLQRHIGNLKSNGSKEIETVWVSCEGENPADVENIGPIQYFPSRGYPGYYFPFANNEGYLSPLVAVWFENPATGVLINIECKAWAKNIFHDRAERRGSVHFELMID
ncbi:sodium/potassium-transporting ATPase subunit beta-2 isoform X2 [Anabrus simplex]|uniref:sodium/potassium-transporting ATPase subunit beta-2 isoform X2 n=1 Tax=Anabrus simplex TaxID=316456 RepID=UPI0034DD246C